MFGVISYDGEKLKIELENMLSRDDNKYFHSSKIFLTSQLMSSAVERTASKIPFADCLNVFPKRCHFS